MMTGVEIIFTISVIVLLGMWGWFIVLGFRTSRLWGAGLIFLFPVSPFMFAYRFERKTRQSIYYFTGSLLFFVLVILYIKFATLDFFDTFSHKIAKVLPSIEYSVKSKPKTKNLILPKPTPIPPPLSKTPEQHETEVITKAPTPLPTTSSRYKTIDISSIKNYLGKNVIITTAFVVHRGKLTSADGAQIEIKKDIAGGSTIMPIKKSKIEKIEVYL
jgi:hypothetical protein